MKRRILDTISSPAALKKLSNKELETLAQEIRNEIIAVTSQTGGHVASSLGAVETILAVHSLIDAPHDKFVFDVGHQSYAHKLITGRLDAFSTLRTLDGLSGFPKPSESPYDVHTSGHASDSLSVALGLATARDLAGGNEKIVALIGDAAIAGGMAFEALNHLGQSQTQMVIIMNDNEMSISRNVGALMKHFGAMRASKEYQETRDTLQDAMERSSGVPRALLWFGRNAKDSVKQFFIPHAMIYEQLGIVCTAPIDGHDIALLRDVIGVALESNSPVLVHVVTKKGAGFGPAMNKPELFHGIGPYDPITGELQGASKDSKPYTFTEAFGKALMREMERDERIVAMTAAMRSGTGLSEISERYPERFIDGGITEGHIVGMASGLAIGGRKPVVAIYSTFLQRAIDQMIVDTGLMSLDVVFAIDRAGLVGADGPTHHGLFDLVYTRMIPGMRVLAPSDETELAASLHTALALGGPFAIRYPRGCARGRNLPDEPDVLEEGKSRLLREGDDAAILAFGDMVWPALDAAELLSGEGISVRVVDMRWVQPLDAQAVADAARTGLVVTVEDGVLSGGAGSAVLEELAAQRVQVPVLTLGIPGEFVGSGKTAELMERLSLDSQGIARSIRERLEEVR